MKNKERIINIIKSKIESDYKDDVAILAVYGSYAMGINDEKSDVDFFYIPKTDRANALCYQFIIDGIGYDLFPIRWERLVKIAALDQPLTAVITESKVIFSSTEEDLNRYEGYRKSILKICSPQGQSVLLNKSYEYFNECFIYLHNMKSEVKNMIDLRIESSKIISKIVIVLAFANHTYYKRGMGMNIKDSFELKKLPKDYKALINLIIEASDSKEIIEACEILIKNTREFLLEQVKSKKQQEPYETIFVGYYEELKSVINKMMRACDKKDEYSAFIIAAYFHEEVAQFMAKSEEGIWYNDRNYYSEYSKSFETFIGVDLMKLAAMKEFSALKEAVNEFETKFVDLLVKKGVTIKSYDSIDEFEVDYQKR
ncbi:hypothetical protein SH2C18_29130 [Clostridium sediminicola]|uniref:nucleotidyltransferase domain-containing protein n=1 Tax=Clostridium sediminicola TaxID=3114879 RepID=UPI0031F1CCC6